MTNERGRTNDGEEAAQAAGTPGDAPRLPDGGPVDPAAPHTEMKLAIVRRYMGYVDEAGRGGGFLKAAQAALFRRCIDAYAGVGLVDFGEGHLRDGTALIALNASIPRTGHAPARFTHLDFVEIDQGRAAALQERVDRLDPERRSHVHPGDANVLVPNLLEAVEDRTPTIAVLDPYDLNDLRFATIRTIGTWHAETRERRIEQLVGLQIGRVRRNAALEEGRAPSPATLQALTELLGNDRWKPTMDAWMGGRATWAEVFGAMRDSFKEELARIGYRHVLHCDVPDNDPLYSLVFASDHEEAARIMRAAIDHWQRDPQLRQQGLGL